jgi:hypothetical protein
LNNLHHALSMRTNTTSCRRSASFLQFVNVPYPDSRHRRRIRRGVVRGNASAFLQPADMRADSAGGQPWVRGRKSHPEQIWSALPQIEDIDSSREDFSVGPTSTELGYASGVRFTPDSDRRSTSRFDSVVPQAVIRHKRTGLIRATPPSAAPRSTASRLIARRER